ncbi:hypothetical protein SAMN04487939_103133 [Lysobacter sp. yr284]|uniref:hypothetical protein n=1 Tax=Lysobacter sp. yr284 TaxID=1761791 RepID=UPI00089C56FB|nr:hypothetical protein [Lysobacter sp. yr284]SDY55010.1 hypothetical protein SAMN04487939_103133 [Lysobacter sp. yr284]
MCLPAAASTAAAPAWSPLLLALAAPAHWLVARGAAVAIKVAASWLLAVALLALSAAPALAGDVPDHLQ